MSFRLFLVILWLIKLYFFSIKFFIGVILFILDLMVLDDKIDKWEESGQIDEWIDEGVIYIDKMKT